jgi:Ca2+-binding RTX toxin-like protein
MKRSLNLEALETKDTPSAVTMVGSTLHVEGSPYADTVQVNYDDRGTWWNPFDDQLNVRLTNGYEVIQSSVNALGVSGIGFAGNDGNDTFVNNTGRPAFADGGNGDDVLIGGTGDDYLFGDAGNDWIRGNGGNDNLYGGAGNDTLLGDAGGDYLSGEAGNDALYGGVDADRLSGGADNDYLDGGNDGVTDTLYGDGGNDTMVQYHYRVYFWWSNEDTPADYNSSVDTFAHVYIG